MAAEQQLERSVLERKERDELRAIAQAMSLDTNSRSKKADIIDQILRAAGVEVGAAPTTNGEGRAPARARAAKATAAGGDDAPADAPAETPSANGHDAEASAPAANGAEATPAEPAKAETEPAGDSGPGQGGGQARQNQGGGGQHRQQQNQGGGEPGNRRSRRRRGRERGGGQGGERELQGGGQEAQYQGELVPVKGLLDLRDEGYGFLRADGYLPSSRDVYVSISQARRFALRKGDYVEGASRPAASNEKFPALIRIDSVSGLSPDEARNRPRFEDLTPLFPDEKLRLETTGPAEVTTRIIDLLSPIGKGQRGMIVSPPKAGKTTILKQIAHSIEANNPEVHLIVLLVDERPEEVTDMRRSVRGDVVASTFDRPSDEHTAISELTIERAKRLVELGKDVVIVLDGITRLARAYNLAQPATGRIMSGGVDSGALYPPKKFFGAARNIEEGGSLTILATALVETGSKMDEVIFEEFKGTGNMELRLDRRLAERRLYPSIDVNASSTRHEELLFERGALQQVWKLRRVLNGLAQDGSAAAGLELLIGKIRDTKSNDEFLAEIAKGPAPPV
jgi:transcription termination factor Rho